MGSIRLDVKMNNHFCDDEPLVSEFVRHFSRQRVDGERCGLRKCYLICLSVVSEQMSQFEVIFNS